jgi:hypothetical protein
VSFSFFLSPFSFVLAASAFWLGLALSARPPARATCNCAGGELEIAFLLDCSGSMNHTLSTLQEQIKRIYEVLEGQTRSCRAAVVIYRTQEYVGRQKKTEVLPFTRDKEVLARFLQGQSADGGGEELVDDGLAAALKELEWTKGARKVAILMGDEQPMEDRQPRCLELAQAYRERGIVLHAVTASQTAWIYWAPAHTTSWKQQLMDMGDEAKRVFRLPHFDDLAAAAGGLSVSSWNSRELLVWLLGFGMGLNKEQAQAKVDIARFLEWSEQRNKAEARERQGPPAPGETAGAPLIAWLRHGGEWQVPRHFEALFEQLGERLSLSGPSRATVLNLTDAAVERCPLLYVTGHGPVKWSRIEKEKLKDHLQAGGFLIADACCGSAGFSASMREILKELFPDRSLEKLPPSHPLFSCGYRIEKVRRSAEPRTGRLESVEPELYGLELTDPATGRPRLAAVLSPYSLGCCWLSRPLGVFCQYHDADGQALTANILLWALTR